MDPLPSRPTHGRPPGSVALIVLTGISLLLWAVIVSAVAPLAALL